MQNYVEVQQKIIVINDWLENMQRWHYFVWLEPKSKASSIWLELYFI